MKERPILFSGPMVRAILEGRKTVTRRVALVRGIGSEYLSDPSAQVACPFGVPGDRLWVRETMKRVDSGLRSEVWTYDADGVPVMLPRDDPRVPAMIAWAHHKKGSTCVSIHMPRWASRITLDVVSVRAERAPWASNPWVWRVEFRRIELEARGG